MADNALDRCKDVHDKLLLRFAHAKRCRFMIRGSVFSKFSEGETLFNASKSNEARRSYKAACDELNGQLMAFLINSPARFNQMRQSFRQAGLERIYYGVLSQKLEELPSETRRRRIICSSWLIHTPKPLIASKRPPRIAPRCAPDEPPPKARFPWKTLSTL